MQPVDKFNENGYVILKEVFDETTLEQIRNLVSQIDDYANLQLEDPFSPYYLKHRPDQGVLFDLFQRHPEFQRLAKNDVILDFLEQVLGPNITLYENSLVYKPKGKVNEVPWHQDFINRAHEQTKLIVWMALDEVVPENGAMKVIPGSHKKGFLPFYQVKGETHHTRVRPECIEEEKAVFVPMNAGDVLVFHQCLLHSSERVEGDKPRRAYRVSYQGFEQIYTPRATPIVMRGGKPGILRQKFPRKERDLPKKSFFQRACHALGHKLLNI
ncbi:phytanoyl-CoA dioxygenase family protein [Rapidithrix thailandica]|uniref:Phytanoyl-CoA dioxygenase family protein n=1 Tax=Rapidithrix thailandica TaxID=413964 RepID=A0AAW9RY28_9BACT